MKLRKGFVSNSSSSSFIISEEEYDSIPCNNCKKIIETLFTKKKAKDIILEDSCWNGDIQNYYDDYEGVTYIPPMLKYCKSDATIWFTNVEMDEAYLIRDILKAMQVNYEYEEH